MGYLSQNTDNTLHMHPQMKPWLLLRDIRVCIVFQKLGSQGVFSNLVEFDQQYRLMIPRVEFDQLKTDLLH